MCHLGEVISIDRHGMGKVENDTIAKASFEKTMEHFINGALYNERDTIKSVSSRIAVGQIIPGGTGCFDLLFDTDKLEQSEYSVNDTYGRMLFTPLEEEALISDLLKYDNINMSFHIPK